MTDTELRRKIDRTRGELDREHGQEPGRSCPITTAYLDGYGDHPDARAHRAQEQHREIHHRHGWHT